MNFAGAVFGASLALCVAGAFAATFLRDTRAAVVALSATMAGVAGICLALGNDFTAVLVAGLLASAVPVVLLLALRVAPAAPRDVKPAGGMRAGILVLGLLALAFVLAAVLVAAPWIPAGGTRQSGIEWLGSRHLTDHLALLDVLGLLVAVSATAAVALLRGRAVPRP